MARSSFQKTKLIDTITGNMDRKAIAEIISRFASENQSLMAISANEYANAFHIMLKNKIKSTTLDELTGGANGTLTPSQAGFFKLGTDDSGVLHKLPGETEPANLSDSGVYGQYFEKGFGKRELAPGESVPQELPDMFRDILGALSNIELKTAKPNQAELKVGKSTFMTSLVEKVKKGSDENITSIDKGDKYNAFLKPILTDALFLLTIIQKMLAFLFVDVSIEKETPTFRLFKYNRAILYVGLRVRQLIKKYKDGVDLSVYYKWERDNIDKSPSSFSKGSNNVWPIMKVTGEIQLKYTVKNKISTLKLSEMYSKPINMWKDDQTRYDFFVHMRNSDFIDGTKDIDITPKLRKFYLAETGKTYDPTNTNQI